MVRTDEYLEPQKYYERVLKDTHAQNVSDYFDELTKQSKIDVEANKATCDKYYKEKANLNKLNRSMSGLTVATVFLWIGVVLGLVLGGVFIALGAMNHTLALIIVGPILLVVAVGLIVFYFALIRKKKKDLKTRIDEKTKVVNALENEAYEQVYPLLNLFNDREAVTLMEKTAPLLDFEETLTPQFEERIVNQFNDQLEGQIDRSALVVNAGTLNTNPFVLKQSHVCKMLPEVYTGTLVITYTRRVSDGKGGYTTTTVTQTLTATVTRPKPHYGVETELKYYTDAAPNLSFSRSPAGLSGKSDKEVEKIVNKRDKEESKKAEKALKKGQNYTKFANSKFEAYLNAQGRDNELEYRLLFTPLSQTNFCYSFAQTSPYHDDIYLNKTKCVNTIMSNHDDNMDYSGDRSNYYHFDYEVIKKKFNDYNNEFFKGLYFDFVPLLNIPLYHQHQSAPYISPRNKHYNLISYYESEVLANKFDPSLFKPASCDTNVILKTRVLNDAIEVTGYGYEAVPHTDFIPVMGGDGYLHNVPVHYYEYELVSDSYLVNLINKDSKTLDNNLNNIINYKMYRASFNQGGK